MIKLSLLLRLCIHCCFSFPPLTDYLWQLELFLLINFNELNFGFLQQVKHPLISSTETNSMAGPADFHQHLSTIPSHASCFMYQTQWIKQLQLDDEQHVSKLKDHRLKTIITTTPWSTHFNLAISFQLLRYIKNWWSNNYFSNFFKE